VRPSVYAILFPVSGKYFLWGILLYYCGAAFCARYISLWTKEREHILQLYASCANKELVDQSWRALKRTAATANHFQLPPPTVSFRPDLTKSSPRQISCLCTSLCSHLDIQQEILFILRIKELRIKEI